uniref:Peptidyl-prolyl cis-trans isomerase n=1 Tax=Chenopodium quinoa TaxID=63459 RepID=A0A803N8M9_CHEQI
MREGETEKEAREWEDLSDLAAVEYSICLSKEEGGVHGWVRKGQMVPEIEEAAFSAPLNKIVRCKTKFGWHLLQVVSEREGALLGEVQPSELNEKLQDPNFTETAQLIDVQEPEEMYYQSIFAKFSGSSSAIIWTLGTRDYNQFDPNKDTYASDTAEYVEIESDPERAFVKTITAQFQTLLGVSLIEILLRYSTDEIYLGQRDTPEWTFNAEPIAAFERFQMKLSDIEKNITERNNDKIETKKSTGIG